MTRDMEAKNVVTWDIGNFFIIQHVALGKKSDRDGAQRRATLPFLKIDIPRTKRQQRNSRDYVWIKYDIEASFQSKRSMTISPHPAHIQQHFSMVLLS